MPLAAHFFVKILSKILSIYLHIYLECRNCFFSCRMQDSCFFLGQGLPCLALYRLATQLQIAKGDVFGLYFKAEICENFSAREASTPTSHLFGGIDLSAQEVELDYLGLQT